MSVHEQRRYDSMVNMIFLCYRSQVDAYAAALLDHLLSEHFGADNVFRASRSIKPGEDYRKALSAAAERSSAMVVIIGQTWMGEFSKEMSPSTEKGWVEAEIEIALLHKVPIIPLLLTHAERPTLNQLPTEISALGNLQYLRFDYRNIASDFSYLRTELSKYLSLEPIPAAEVVEQSISALASAVQRLDKSVSSLDERISAL